ncbi:MAG: 50S ribosomal protein L5 [Simkaniaceae bacterium]|nr:50S ribosomal protein L5 [Simkaniaceae bacterium]
MAGSRLKKRYQDEIKPALAKKFGYSNSMLIPKIHKIVVSMGAAEALKDRNIIQDLTKELALITGQKPKITKSKKSIANFKLREGYPIGLMVTLRGERMYEFLDRFINIVSPRIRDFRGFNKKADGRGNYSVGLDDHQVFPELNLDEIKRTQGLNVTIVTSAVNDAECVELLGQCGFPFKKDEK